MKIPKGKYAGNITVNLTDTSEPVNIAIKGGITYNGTQQVMFINVKNADEVTITNDGHEVNCKPSDAHFLDVSSGNVTVNGGTYVTATRNVVMAYAGTTTLNDMTTETSGYAVTSSRQVQRLLLTVSSIPTAIQIRTEQISGFLMVAT